MEMGAKGVEVAFFFWPQRRVFALPKEPAWRQHVHLSQDLAKQVWQIWRNRQGLALHWPL